jgi:hypothetical protein
MLYFILVDGSFIVGGGAVEQCWCWVLALMAEIYGWVLLLVMVADYSIMLHKNETTAEPSQLH